MITDDNNRCIDSLVGVMDVLHRTAVLGEKGGRDGLARSLAEAAQGRAEQVRLVAQTVVNILPDDDSERRLLEGFLQGGIPCRMCRGREGCCDGGHQIGKGRRRKRVPGLCSRRGV